MKLYILYWIRIPQFCNTQLKIVFKKKRGILPIYRAASPVALLALPVCPEHQAGPFYSPPVRQV